MATASHEHIPDLSASLSKSHHRAPISDLWGPSLSQKARTAEASSDYAMEIARDTSRGPLMSSACATASHEVHEEPKVVPDTVPISSKVGSVLWSSPGHGTVPGPIQGSVPSSVPATVPATPVSNGSSSSAGVSSSSGSATTIPLRGLTPTTSPSYHPNGPTSVGSVTPMTHFRSGIWGPRRSFSAYSGQAAFAQQPSAGSVYANVKTPWTVDLAVQTAGSPANTPIAGVHGMPGPSMSNGQSPVNGVSASAIPASVPVQPGFYGIPHPTVSGSVPSSGTLQKIPTPPRSSPSPPTIAGAGSARQYLPRGAQQSSASTSAPIAAMHQHQSEVVQTVQAAQHQGQHQSHSGPQALRGGVHHSHHQGGHHSSHDGLMNGNHGRPSKKNGRPSTNTELYKTELCASYMSTGGNCPYGEKCQFAHGPEELKSVDRPPKWRSKPCQNWVKTGSCSYNERCCFRHDVPVGHGQQ